SFGSGWARGGSEQSSVSLEMGSMDYMTRRARRRTTTGFPSAPQETGARFKFGTDWCLAAADPLAKVIQMQWHALDLDALFDGTTYTSATGHPTKDAGRASCGRRHRSSPG